MHTLVPFEKNRTTQPNGSDIKYEEKWNYIYLCEVWAVDLVPERNVFQNMSKEK